MEPWRNFRGWSCPSINYFWSVDTVGVGRRYRFARWVLIAAFLTAQGIGSQSPVVLDGSWFTIVATDRREAAEIRATTERFRQFAQRYGFKKRGQPGRGRIELIPETGGPEWAGHRITALEGGEVLLSLRGYLAADEIGLALAFSDLWLAVSEGVGQAPARTVYGLAAMFLEQSNPGYFSAEVEESPPSLFDLIGSPAAFPVDYATISAWFWLWRYLEQTDDPASLVGLFEENPAGRGVADRRALAELDWRTFLSRQRESGFSTVLSARESEDLLFDLLEIWVEADGERTAATMADLWEVRKAAWVEFESQLRLHYLKRYLPAVNPAYFNAFHSGGLLLESLAGNRDQNFVSASSALASDLGDARALRAVLESAQP